MVSVLFIYTGLFLTWIILLVVWMIFLMILSSTTDTIIKTILLYYAQHGKLSAGLEGEESIIDLAGEK